MTPNTAATSLFAKFSWLPAALFVGVLAVFALIVTTGVAHILDHYQGYRESLAKLARLQERPHPSQPSGVATPPGSPLLEGGTATVASAMLLQRVTSAIAAAGGNVISSEVEQGGTQSRDGYLKVSASFEIPQTALQRVVHDLEAGMPFLFVEQMVVQASTSGSDTDRLRVRLAVSGLWPGGRS